MPSSKHPGLENAPPTISPMEDICHITFEHAAVGMLHIGLDGKILRANSHICRVLEYLPEELIGLSATALAHHDEQAACLQIRQSLARSDATAHADIRCVKKSGAVIWVRASISRLTDRAGNPLCFAAVAQEITDQKTTESALRLSEDRLLHAQRLSHSGNWEIDLATKLVWASEEAYRIYGIRYDPGAPMLDLATVQSYVVGEDRAMLEQAMRQLLLGNCGYDVEFRIERRYDKALRIIHSRAVADRDDAGSPHKVRGVLQDVTDSRLAEANFKAAIATAMDGFWLFDRKGTILEANGALCALLGYTREELLTKTIADLEADLDAKEIQACISQVLAAGNIRFETRLWRKDGTAVDVEVCANSTSITDRLCVFLRDITERKKREEEIRYLSYHDVLTGLYNRAFFEEECNRLDTERQLPLSIVMGDINGLKLTNDIFGHAEGDTLLKEIAAILRECCRKEDIIARMGGDEFCILLPRTDLATAQAVCQRIDKACNEHLIESENRSYHPSISLGCATKVSENQSIETVIRNAEDLMYRQKLLEQNSMHGSLLSSIRATMQERNHETRDHGDRLIRITKAIGEAMGLARDQLYELELLSSLHDIGMIGEPDHILKSFDPLTSLDWAEIRKHPEIGYRIALSSPELVPVANGILSHHERWDGAGYPKGMAGERIPLLARIFAVADAYEAMTNPRTYRKTMTPAEAAAEIMRNAGAQFDPDVAAAFTKLVESPEV